MIIHFIKGFLSFMKDQKIYFVIQLISFNFSLNFTFKYSIVILIHFLIIINYYLTSSFPITKIHYLF